MCPKQVFDVIIQDVSLDWLSSMMAPSKPVESGPHIPSVLRYFGTLNDHIVDHCQHRVRAALEAVGVVHEHSFGHENKGYTSIRIW